MAPEARQWLSNACTGHQKKEPSSTASNYVDCAWQHCKQYETTSLLLAVTAAVVVVVFPPMEESTKMVVCHYHSEELLETSNDGNQMLHESGWKSGQVLGHQK